MFENRWFPPGLVVAFVTFPADELGAVGLATPFLHIVTPFGGAGGGVDRPVEHNPHVSFVFGRLGSGAMAVLALDLSVFPFQFKPGIRPVFMAEDDRLPPSLRVAVVTLPARKLNAVDLPPLRYVVTSARRASVILLDLVKPLLRVGVTRCAIHLHMFVPERVPCLAVVEFRNLLPVGGQVAILTLVGKSAFVHILGLVAGDATLELCNPEYRSLFGGACVALGASDFIVFPIKPIFGLFCMVEFYVLSFEGTGVDVAVFAGLLESFFVDVFMAGDTSGLKAEICNGARLGLLVMTRLALGRFMFVFKGIVGLIMVKL